MRNQPDPPPQTRIRAACPECGEVELVAPDIGLKVSTRGSRSFYTFMCPDCRVLIAKPADERIVRLLLSGGVQAEFWDPPAELLEPRTGPPISYDDLLDLHLALERPDFWERLQPPADTGSDNR